MEKRAVSGKLSWENLRFSWDEYFMHIAIDTAQRSSCRNEHTGSIIVKNKRVISSGYNGRSPQFKKNCLEEGCEKEKRQVTYHEKGKNVCLGSHAETNALLQQTAESKEGAIMYNVVSPCYSCAKQIAAAQISGVVYIKKYKEEFDAVQNYFNRTGIDFRRFIPKKENLSPNEIKLLEDCLDER